MAPDSTPSASGRHSILDLAPLELDCMNALWPFGEATVRQIQEALQPTRPRAYTTIMTILDRLTQKGIVERRKSGRAWIYRANVSADQARAHAVSQVVDGFFGGSAGALATHLTAQGMAGFQAGPLRLAPAVHAMRPVVARSDSQRARTDSGNPAGNAPVQDNLDTALL
jgi:BlaI family penicillinase repressor